MGNTQSEIYYNRIKLLINQNRILRKHNIYLKNVFNYHNEEIYQLTRKFKRYTRKYWYYRIITI